MNNANIFILLTALAIWIVALAPTCAEAEPLPPNEAVVVGEGGELSTIIVPYRTGRGLLWCGIKTIPVLYAGRVSPQFGTAVACQWYSTLTGERSEEVTIYYPKEARI